MASSTAILVLAIINGDDENHALLLIITNLHELRECLKITGHDHRDPAGLLRMVLFARSYEPIQNPLGMRSHGTSRKISRLSDIGRLVATTINDMTRFHILFADHLLFGA